MQNNIPLQELSTYDELQQILGSLPYLLLYGASPSCTVCHADRPRVAQLAARLDFPAVAVDLTKVPEVAGQLSLFAAPAVLLFAEGREYHRQARFLDLMELELRMVELKNFLNDGPFHGSKIKE